VGLLDRLRQLRGGAPADDIAGRTQALVVHGNEFGFDPFGLSREHVSGAIRFATWMYRYYFRAQAFGVEHIPTEGRVLFVANHSGQLTGTPENCRRLLQAEEAVLVFPEGARGISKPFAKRYQLAPFGKGFMRLALELQCPIVPVAVIGAEEQAPAVNFTALAKLLRAPAFPIVPYPPFVPLVPLPTKYRIYFGAPLRFTGDPDDDDDVLDEQAGQVRTTIQTMVHVGLRERKHVFY